VGSSDPLIFSLQNFCIHDGPGVRSLVFFKGCPLRCPWCQNVESWKAGVERAFKPALCICCGACSERCPGNAPPGPMQPAVGQCMGCLACVEVCPSGALVRFGVSKTPEEIVGELRPEFPLLISSGGGVTFTGGEPALYPAFGAALAKLLRAEGVGTAMETSGFFDLGRTAPLLREVELVLFDIKIFDQEEHKRICGADNTAIKENLMALARDGTPRVWPRLPVVPGMTAGMENIRAWAGFLRELGLSSLTLVPYHPMGEAKRLWLGLPAGPELRVPTEGELGEIGEALAAEGINVCRPGEECF
jgi:glycyl-radical enzyme activating protein